MRDNKIETTADSKHFDTWMPLKECIHFTGREWAFREKEIWWIAIGENVGTEVNGIQVLRQRGDNNVRCCHKQVLSVHTDCMVL